MSECYFCKKDTGVYYNVCEKCAELIKKVRRQALLDAAEMFDSEVWNYDEPYPNNYEETLGIVAKKLRQMAEEDA